MASLPLGTWDVGKDEGGGGMMDVEDEVATSLIRWSINERETNCELVEFKSGGQLFRLD